MPICSNNGRTGAEMLIAEPVRFAEEDTKGKDEAIN
jgi:hypothetical protein